MHQRATIIIIFFVSCILMCAHLYALDENITQFAASEDILSDIASKSDDQPFVILIHKTINNGGLEANSSKELYCYSKPRTCSPSSSSLPPEFFLTLLVAVILGLLSKEIGTCLLKKLFIYTTTTENMKRLMKEEFAIQNCFSRRDWLALLTIMDIAAKAKNRTSKLESLREMFDAQVSGKGDHQ